MRCAIPSPPGSCAITRTTWSLVADILGHADIKTTRRYAQSDLEQRRAALEDLAD
jgi:integrase